MSFRARWGLKELPKKFRKLPNLGPAGFLSWEKHTSEAVRAGHHAPKDSERLVHDSLTLKKKFGSYKMDHNERTSPGESMVVDFPQHFFPFTFWVINSLPWSYPDRAKLICYQ